MTPADSPRFTPLVLADVDAVLHHAWTQVTETAQSLQRPPRVLTTGGRFGTRFTAGLADLGSALEVWWSDERYLPDDAPERNDYSRPSSTVITWHRYPDRGWAAEATTKFAASLPSAFDWGVMSLGEDGHLASLFPARTQDWLEAQEPVLAVEPAPKPPPRRLTLALPGIARVERLVLAATGDSKVDAVRQLLRHEPTWPSTWLAQKEILLLLDEPASAGLSD